MMDRKSLLHGGVTCILAPLREIRFGTVSNRAADSQLIITFCLYIVLFDCYMYINPLMNM